MRPKQVQVKLAIPFIGEVSGSWEPDDAERDAAWELYVELVTRVAVMPLGPTEGMLREALTSLYQLFDVTRGILRRHGPAVAPADKTGDLSFGELAVAVLNGALRPLLSRWHPELAAYEAARPADVSPVEYERAWRHADQLRTDIKATQRLLGDFARTLERVAGATTLLPTTVSDTA